MIEHLAAMLRQLGRRFARPRYIVYVDDNSHYMDPSERYTLGEFATAEAALAAAKALVDEYLTSIYQERMTADEMYKHYTAWGEDPHIVGVKFSAWTYAQERCRELCRPRQHPGTNPLAP